jgi:transcriptional regulator with XRE-family HTH domain
VLGTVSGKRVHRFVLDDGPMVGTLRRKENLTVGQLASALGVSTAAVRRWERGEFGEQRGIPGDVGDALLRALHLTPESHAIGHRSSPAPAHVDRHRPVPARSLLGADVRAEAMRLVGALAQLLSDKGT